MPENGGMYMEEKKCKRRSIRIKEYDYSQKGMYFITICTQGRKKILSTIDEWNDAVGADDSVRPELTKIGRIIKKCLKQIEYIYDNIKLDKYVIMPNHIHAIIIVREGGQSRPPLHKIIQGLKSVTTREYWKIGGIKLWQRNYYEHIIRDEKEYWKIYEYIEQNPMKWKLDEYYKD